MLTNYRITTLLFCALAAQRPCPTGAAETNRYGLKPTEVISWRDAAKHIGQYRCVEGRIRRTKNTGKTCFLNFGARNEFVAVIFSRSFARFPSPPETLYQGKRVRVWGYVEDYKGTPEIIVSSPRQIEADGVDLPIAGSETPTKIRIATYNVHNLFDGHDDPFTRDEERNGTVMRTSASDLRALCSVIRDEIQADVLALQEVEHRELLRKVVRESLPGLAYQHVVLVEGNDNGRDGRGIDVALLSRFPVGKVTSFQHLAFHDAMGLPRRFARDALRVEVFPKRGFKLVLYVLHLKSRHGGTHSRLWRNAEARQVRALAEAEWSPDANIAVLGDFNDDLASETLKALCASEGPRLLTPVAAKDPSGSDTTCRSGGYPPIRFDYILLSPTLAQRQLPGTARIIDTPPARQASDHRAVIVDLRLSD